MDTGYLKHVIAVFDRLGFLRVTHSPHWDVFWSHDYPFSTLRSEMLQLKPHQKVNHFPGSGFLTNKVSLVTGAVFSFIPRAFKVPKEKEQFFKYVEDNPKTFWVQKGSQHRGVAIKGVEDLDLSNNNTFIQEYIGNPFLIDGRRFDIGLYVALTSINPLRLYIYEGDWLIRFCPSEYYPFDSSDRDKYVISDAYLPPWKVPSLAFYYNKLDFNRKQSLFAYLREKGHDPELLAKSLKDAVTEVFLKMEEKLIKASKNYASSRNFFEMVRFDFVLDENLKVYLLEVNMSPNLSSGHFPPNKVLYEQIVFSLLHLVGVDKTTVHQKKQMSEDERNMLASTKDIQTYSSECASTECSKSCSENIVCKLCNGCMTDASALRQAYMEHLNRYTWRRLFPIPFESASTFNPASDEQFQSLNSANKVMTLWFRGKCLQDPAWCS
ncbi:hypothetical protein CAPTEDRAFT_102035 [Capitella teleta]|uniref:Tubulin--tyrosine ligase-like protein 9 n=1 Tax=Capitella teleta TaxID=283909 RepID=R7VCQ4_CAPTE|nr:hypothetical protein CAPTEDRAFT_102035 [Capitella teleta]|eukprot:ELU16337.1 hypothetical protein CAPTEDRAFT_102035 [Capitella teleta]